MRCRQYWPVDSGLKNAAKKFSLAEHESEKDALERVSGQKVVAIESHRRGQVMHNQYKIVNTDAVLRVGKR